VRGAPFSPPNRREIIRHGAHPTGLRPAPESPQRELRQRGVFDAGGGLIGHVANAYLDAERILRFVDDAMSGLIGLGRKHRLVPTLAKPHEALRRAANEHNGHSSREG
jgi:hypothetical protein